MDTGTTENNNLRCRGYRSCHPATSETLPRKRDGMRMAPVCGRRGRFGRRMAPSCNVQLQGQDGEGKAMAMERDAGH